MNSSNITTGILIVFGSVIALIFGKVILAPFLFALLFYFLIRAIRRVIDLQHFIREHVPSWLKNIVSALIIYSLIGIMIKVLIVNSEELVKAIFKYQGNMTNIIIRINDTLGFDILKTVNESIEQLDYSTIANTLFNQLTSMTGNLLMILFYILFLFIEEASFKKKLQLIFKGEKHKQVSLLLNNIEKSITHYIGLKTLISLISSACCFIVLISFGVESPLFWSFIIFIMNFIPIIGALLGVILPTAFSLIQFGEFFLPIILFFVLGSIQTIISNILEPKLMGDSLNISPLVALISLAIWGSIWGITGMVVSVPITVILIILLAQFPRTRTIAILLSHHGRI